MDNFLYLLFNAFGFELMSFSEVVAYIGSLSSEVVWHCVFNPSFIIPFMFYFAFAFMFLFITFILPFRYFKRIVKAPNIWGKVK